MYPIEANIIHPIGADLYFIHLIGADLFLMHPIGSHAASRSRPLSDCAQTQWRNSDAFYFAKAVVKTERTALPFVELCVRMDSSLLWFWSTETEEGTYLFRLMNILLSPSWTLTLHLHYLQDAFQSVIDEEC